MRFHRPALPAGPPGSATIRRVGFLEATTVPDRLHLASLLVFAVAVVLLWAADRTPRLTRPQAWLYPTAVMLGSLTCLAITVLAGLWAEPRAAAGFGVAAVLLALAAHRRQAVIAARHRATLNRVRRTRSGARRPPAPSA